MLKIMGKIFTILHWKPKLLITFANSLDPDLARQNVAPDLDPKMVFEKIHFEKNQQTTIKHSINTDMQRIMKQNHSFF